MPKYHIVYHDHGGYHWDVNPGHRIPVEAVIDRFDVEESTPHRALVEAKRLYAERNSRPPTWRGPDAKPS